MRAFFYFFVRLSANKQVEQKKEDPHPTLSRKRERAYVSAYGPSPGLTTAAASYFTQDAWSRWCKCRIMPDLPETARSAALGRIGLDVHADAAKRSVALIS
jgi:hypothetical protein